MANKRMFSKTIVETDAFLDMPKSSQLLYFHLNMEADDDGFVASPKKVMRVIGSNDDDYKILVVKRFIIPFENGVCVIKHWLIHNYIRKDTYTETKYLSEKNSLQVKENGSYTERGRLVDGSATQVRLGKVRLGKNTAEPTPEGVFSFDSYLEEMGKSTDRRIKLIAYYFVKRGIRFDNYEEVQQAIKRHIKSATSLKSFDSNKIKVAMNECEKKHSEVGWTLETVLKILTK